MQDLKCDGLPLDDFCLASLLQAYSNATPKQIFRAEAVLQGFASNCRCLSDNLSSKKKMVKNRFLFVFSGTTTFRVFP